MTDRIAASVKSAAVMTDLSETTIREAIDRQELPAYRVGRAIRIQVADLQAWIASRTRVGSEEDQ